MLCRSRLEHRPEQAGFRRADAVAGMVVKDSNGDGRLEVGSGDKVGASCSLCHTITDGSVLTLPGGGSIGKRVDGPANHNINLGAISATADNSRALYPVLQLALTANKGKTLGRAPKGLTENSTEAEVDAYLSNPEFYPVGMFDDTFDGNGDPMHNTPQFRQDLAAPFGSEGTIARLDNFNNLVYAGLFDQTTLTTPGGRAFLRKLGGPAGDEIADDYIKDVKTGFDAACKDAKIDDLTFHDLRRTAATRLGDAGANAFYIQQILGHEDVSTSQIYTIATDASLRRAMEALAGRDGTVAIVPHTSGTAASGGRRRVT